jgi:hypothetical protein
MNCFVAGIVKGLIEHNDKYRHFGSFLAFNTHMRNAVQCGVVDGNESVTEKGREWYEQKRFAELPFDRAYAWARPIKYFHIEKD